MSTSSNHTMAVCPVLPRQAHGGEFANFITRLRIPFESPLRRVRLTYSWVQFKRIRLEAVYTRSPELTMLTLRLEHLHTKYLCRKILNTAPCSQTLLLGHRPSQLTSSLSASVHSSIFPNSISNNP